MRRVVRVSGLADKCKRGKRLCEHCLWRPPDNNLLHAHHVIPLCAGGPDSPDNVLVLCPNCHALAHYVARRTNTTRTYAGPRTPLELRRWIAAARKPLELRKLRQEHIMADVVPILTEMRA